MATITIRLNNEEETLFKDYANFVGDSLSVIFKKSLREQIELEHDIEEFRKAKAEFESNPITYTYDEIVKEIGL